MVDDRRGIDKSTVGCRHVVDGSRRRVLQALLRGGADIPFSCRKGTCHACLMRVEEGDPGASSREGLREALTVEGHFLPCCASPTEDLVVARPDPSRVFVRAVLAERKLLAPDVARLRLEAETSFSWRPGQYLNLRRADGLTRSYSIASLADEDGVLELHVKRVPGGTMSAWLVDEAPVGVDLEIQGPAGRCTYDPTTVDRPLLLLATGTGLAPVLAVARDALRAGHRGGVFLYRGSRTVDGLYAADDLDAHTAAHPTFHHAACVSGAGDLPRGVTRGRVVDLALARHPQLEGFVAVLAGHPDMVDEARHRLFAAGIRREDIHADPFEHARPFQPDDTAKLAAIAPDPEMWEALDRGERLRAILTDFYDRVYEDPRLAPFFHKVTKERAIDKQYSFLADLFTGEKGYFGLKPFNAHHWMIISDEIFDHRERLIEDCMRRGGLAEPFIRRWCAIHERFRREIVKHTARGLIVDGVEHHLEGFTEEVLEVSCLCDGCGEEMASGSTGRLHARTGELFCAPCSARSVGMTHPPPPPA